jgi:uncharacterized protein (DUF4415 family)
MNDEDDDMLAEYDFSDATRGAVAPAVSGKTRITIRIDNDILNWFRERVHSQGGGNYQTMMNAALRAYIEDQDQDWAKLLRRVVREELQAAGIGTQP